MLHDRATTQVPSCDSGNSSTVFDLLHHAAGACDRQPSSTLRDLPFYKLDDLSSVLKLPGQTRVDRDFETFFNRHACHVFWQHRRKHSRWGKHVEDLSRFLDSPREILFEILGHLHPMDLYLLALANKWFRAIVMSRSSAWLWDVVFLRHAEIPSPPNDVPQPKWADVIFGRIECTECGYVEVEWDSMLAKRQLCQGCRFSLIQEKVYSELDLLERSDPAVEPNAFQEFQLHLKPQLDLQYIADRVVVYRSMVYWGNRVELAQKCLQYFKTHSLTKDFVGNVLTQHRLLDEWADRQARRMDDEFETRRKYFSSLRERVVAELVRRLKPLGYTESDVREFFGRPSETLSDLTLIAATFSSFLAPGKNTLKQPVKFIRSNWPAVKATLEPMILPIKECRVTREREELIDYRAETILHVLQDHAALTPDDPVWDILPSLHDLHSYEPFRSMARLPSDVHLDPESIIQELIAFIERWPPRTTEELAAICPSNFQIPACHSRRPGTCSLEAASCVFSCVACAAAASSSSRWCLIGWSAVIAHKTCPRRVLYNPFQVSEPGCDAAMALLDELGLDPCTTLPSQLDEHGEHFACLNCPATDGLRTALTWRQCILHFVETHAGGTRPPPSWKTMTPEEVAASPALRTEKDDPVDEDDFAFSDELL
ncbi:hypothetical protein LshimejAT787_1402730 [Lyophyllum shimeji]|uniref:F-box domain-containing protein n=1 Tax=Lyophyllum shimeji TaxID=47721 RepID=A0A9P3PY65_LYOSH|nr:hypothetical protein LshimejAT787_1402730 [Lyophyllum shimeji]